MSKIKFKNKKIAIIGGGISGLSAAYYLAKDHKVFLYEKEPKLGGHAITLKKKLAIDDVNTKDIFFDIGFLVYNNRNYPNFSKLIDSILVKTENSNMSFSVTNKKSGFEYGSNGILSLTNNFKNLFSFDFYNILFSIFRFYRRSKELIIEERKDITLGDFLNSNNFSKSLVYNHIIPMCAAIWSTSSKKVLDMPANYILKFLDNHGLLSLFNRPQWKTITNGSIKYVNKLEQITNVKIFKNEKVVKVIRRNKKILVRSKRSLKVFDYIVFAIHADDILKILEFPTNEERDIFSKYNYEKNLIYVHHDKSLMPSNKNVWSSWNVITSDNNAKVNSNICVTYWINKLQNFCSKDPVLVTLNPPKAMAINKSKILKKLQLKHPLLRKNHLLLSEKVEKIQGLKKTYYTGAWLGYGFHEDGLKASKKIVNLISKL